MLAFTRLLLSGIIFAVATSARPSTESKKQISRRALEQCVHLGQLEFTTATKHGPDLVRYLVTNNNDNATLTTNATEASNFFVNTKEGFENLLFLVDGEGSHGMKHLVLQTYEPRFSSQSATGSLALGPNGYRSQYFTYNIFSKLKPSHYRGNDTRNFRAKSKAAVWSLDPETLEVSIKNWVNYVDFKNEPYYNHFNFRSVQSLNGWIANDDKVYLETCIDAQPGCMGPKLAVGDHHIYQLGTLRFKVWSSSCSLAEQDEIESKEAESV